MIPKRIRVLSASDRTAPAAEKIRRVHGNQRLQISVQLPQLADVEKIQKLLAALEQRKRRPLSFEELVIVTGASEHDQTRVMDAAYACGVQVLSRLLSNQAHGIIRLAGTLGSFKKLFPGLELNHFVTGQGQRFIGREGAINIPIHLPIVGVHGFDTRPAAHPRYRLAKAGEQAPVPDGLTLRGLKKLLGAPVDKWAQIPGVVTAFISLGGDNVKIVDDLKLAAAYEGIPAATVIGHSVDGTPLAGDVNDGATGENALDLQNQALLNPLGYVIIFRAANSTNGFATAIETANVYPGVNNGSEILPLRGTSASWGRPEPRQPEQILERWERALTAARLRCRIVTAATGDDGSSDGTFSDTPDAPSCVPGCIGAAGVEIHSADGKTVDKILVWNDQMDGGGATGGGISKYFPVMPEEARLNLPVSTTTGKPGHSASVLAGIAAPKCGPVIFMPGGKRERTGGTSSSAPELLMDLAFVQAGLKQPIDILGFIYKCGETFCRQVTEPGDNGSYPCKPGDIANIPVGFGVPVWDKLESAAQEAAR